MSKEKEKAKSAQAGAAERESFEEAFHKLEGIVERLEDASLPIEESLKSFEEGVRLTRLCKQILDEAEKKVELLVREPGGGLKTQPFPEEAAEGKPGAAATETDEDKGLPF